MSLLRTFFSDDRAAAAAEMALVLPFLVTLLFVTFEGGYFLWSEHKVVKGVRDGARYAGRLSLSNYDCSSATGTGPVAGTVSSTVQPSIKNLTRTGKITGGTPVISVWTDAGVTVTVDCYTGKSGIYAGNGGKAPVVRVSATVPYPSTPLAGLIATLGFDTSQINLRAQADSPVIGL